MFTWAGLTPSIQWINIRLFRRVIHGSRYVLCALNRPESCVVGYPGIRRKCRRHKGIEFPVIITALPYGAFRPWLEKVSTQDLGLSFQLLNCHFARSPFIWYGTSFQAADDARRGTMNSPIRSLLWRRYDFVRFLFVLWLPAEVANISMSYGSLYIDTDDVNNTVSAVV